MGSQRDRTGRKALVLVVVTHQYLIARSDASTESEVSPEHNHPDQNKTKNKQLVLFVLMFIEKEPYLGPKYSFYLMQG